MLYRLGRKALKTDSRTLKLENYLTTSLPAPPISVDWTKGITEWGVMKNDSLGDCTIAGCGHAVQTWSVNSDKEITIDDNDIVSIYSAWDGYVPGDSSTDNGGIELDVLTNWKSKGFVNHKLIGFTSVNHLNKNEIKTAINLFGGIYIGVSLPISAQTQGIWDVTTGDDAITGSWGGHAIWIVGYDSTGLTCITWGVLKKMTWAFFNKYCDESYSLLGQDWINANGKSPLGFDLNQLMSDLSAIR